jgi:serine/threonine/tyrosine protein kinase RAD53
LTGEPWRIKKSVKTVWLLFSRTLIVVDQFVAFRFVRHLLVDDPLRRLSLTNALRHPWLRAHIPFHIFDRNELGDASMNATYDEGEFADENDLPLEAASVSAAPRNGVLQRQSDIVHRAEEEGKALPEPSWEMIAYAAARNDKPSSEKGPNKRMRAELTPLPEDVLDDANMNSSAVEIPGLSAGKVKKSESPDENSANGPRRSRRSKAPRRS